MDHAFSTTALQAKSWTTSSSAPDVADLIINGSIEFNESETAAAALSGLLPYMKSVFTPATKKRSLAVLAKSLRALKAAGLDPCPHIAARRISARREIKSFLDEAVGVCGVRRVLLTGGDPKDPVGPYLDAAMLLKSGVLQDAGVKEVVFAGHPDGHPLLSRAALERTLLEKLELARARNLGASIITQFSFTPKRIVDYCARLAKLSPETPVYVGVPGPCDAARLLGYARRCGVSAPAKAPSDIIFEHAPLAAISDPDALVDILTRRFATLGLANIMGYHVFSFGNALRAAEWMRTKIGPSHILGAPGSQAAG